MSKQEHRNPLMHYLSIFKLRSSNFNDQNFLIVLPDSVSFARRWCDHDCQNNTERKSSRDWHPSPEQVCHIRRRGEPERYSAQFRGVCEVFQSRWEICHYIPLLLLLPTLSFSVLDRNIRVLDSMERAHHR